MSDQRDRFEAWAKAPPREWNTDIAGPKQAWPGSYWSYPVQCAWEAWQAACPEGWQAVPVEPTQEMQNHGSVARYHERLDCKGLYKAMLSAAPKPEDVCKSPD